MKKQLFTATLLIASFLVLTSESCENDEAISTSGAKKNQC